MASSVRSNRYVDLRSAPAASRLRQSITVQRVSARSEDEHDTQV